MKTYLIIGLLFSLILRARTQDLINPYQEFQNTWTEQNPNFPLNCIYQYPPQANYNAPNLDDFLYTPAARFKIGTGQYDGEYQIILDQLPWNFEYYGPCPQGLCLIESNFKELGKSLKLEVVSFPFTMPCWDQPSSCTYPNYGTNTTRDLYMPDDPFASGKWNNLTNTFEGPFPGPLYDISSPTALVSRQFMNDPVSNPSADIWLPHTIIKHTVFLHCENNTSSPIINQFSWYYDNTRGNMKTYPFRAENTVPPTNNADHDVFFRPEILTNIDDGSAVYQCDFNRNSNDDWFDGGSLDYFPLANSNTSCQSTNQYVTNPTPFDLYVDQFTPNWFAAPFNPELRAHLYQSVFFPPYSLLSASLKNKNGDGPAGYVNNLNNTFTYLALNSIPNKFNIDQNINLNIINPSEMTIYNPSEVYVKATASDLHFPSYYTFKTINGVLPHKSRY
ncbi:MAG: hypothetical protein IPO27_01455 [Bacteroidetes bacterium]|nr:hypothetical protein [Bacteroidota bacterium]